MARSTNESKATTITKEVVKETAISITDFSKELEQANEKNKELESKVDSLAAMMEKLMVSQTQSKTESEKSENSEITTKQTGFQAYNNIDPTKRILMANMMNAGGTFITHSGRSIRFDHFGHIQPARFEDLESLVSKYRNYFENIEIRILDEEVVDALYLREFYNKNNITVEEMERIIELKPQDLVEKIKSLNTALQESALCLIISNVAKNNSKYMDKNKWDVLNNAFNINIQEFADRYVVK